MALGLTLSALAFGGPLGPVDPGGGGQDRLGIDLVLAIDVGRELVR